MLTESLENPSAYAISYSLAIHEKIATQLLTDILCQPPSFWFYSESHLLDWIPDVTSVAGGCERSMHYAYEKRRYTRRPHHSTVYKFQH